MQVTKYNIFVWQYQVEEHVVDLESELKLHKMESELQLY